MRILAFFKKRDVSVITGMALGTIIYCMGVVWLLDLGAFYASGVTGISQLISGILERFGVTISKSIFIAILNIPLFIIGWKGVSKRFAILSLSSVALQVVTIAILEYFVTKGFDPFLEIIQDANELPKQGGLLMLSI
ncbi:MAG TPA: hypothetical protein DD618_00765, partial [Acholeplasmatales bacterium]|nr:hypothetical protein [Acholeplasmatales bacterium]